MRDGAANDRQLSKRLGARSEPKASVVSRALCVEPAARALVQVGAASYAANVSMNTSSDELVRTLSRDGGLSVRALVATRLVVDAARRHGTAPTATAALGRTLMGAILLASGAKDDETLQIQVRGNGELGTVMAIADGSGRVRGYAANPTAHRPLRGGKLDVGGAVGLGVLAVVRYHPTWREPYSGIVPLVSGEIAEDLAHYLLESEQTPSALALGVYVGPDGIPEAAGGYLVQALPGASEAELDELAATIAVLPPPSELVRGGLTADGLLDRLLGADRSRQRHRSEPRFACSCTLERIQQAVTLLGRDETREIARTGETLTVRCEFCGEVYALDPEAVAALTPDA
jgi:molecular chaperone Hsp33